MTRSSTHPHWCGGGHVCSIDRPAGEHRSYPLTVDTDTGRIVATRVRTVTGRDLLELRLVLDLPPAEDARQAAGRLLWRLRTVLAASTPTTGRAGRGWSA